MIAAPERPAMPLPPTPHPTVSAMLSLQNVQQQYGALTAQETELGEQIDDLIERRAAVRRQRDGLRGAMSALQQVIPPEERMPNTHTGRARAMELAREQARQAEQAGRAPEPPLAPLGSSDDLQDQREVAEVDRIRGVLDQQQEAMSAPDATMPGAGAPAPSDTPQG